MGTNTIATKRCITTAVSEVLRDMEALAKNPRDTVLGILQEAAKADLPLPTVSHDPFRGGARQRPGSRLPPGVAEAAAHYARMAPEVDGRRTPTHDSLREALKAFADAGMFHSALYGERGKGDKSSRFAQVRSRFLRVVDAAGLRDDDIATMYAKPGEQKAATLERIHVDRLLDGRDPCTGLPLGDHPKMIAGRRAAQLRSEGCSYREAADRMSAEGFPIKHGTQVKRLLEEPWPTIDVRACAECGEPLPNGASAKMRRHRTCKERAKRRTQRAG